MKVLLIGAGGREHAILNQLLLLPSVSHVYITNGGNGGTQVSHPRVEVQNISIGLSPKDFPELVKFAYSNDVDLVVPGPEQPLVDGIKDYFETHNSSGRKIAVFGPSAKAAAMEGSKTFSKDFMARHDIPTAEYRNFSKYEDAVAYVKQVSHRIVIKASGVAAGKGVLIPTSQEEALDALDTIMVKKEFGSAGDEVVIEEFLDGEEISILTISDGYSFVNLPPAQDHKKIGEGDVGPNTGGMGLYAPAPIASDGGLMETINNTIIKPLIDGMRKDGFPFVGVLFTGIIVVDGKPKVLEYNVRFGDPETQSVLPLIDETKTDLAQVFLAAAEGRLDLVPFEVDLNRYATTVVVALGGYPGLYEKGANITFGDMEGVTVVHAGTKKTEDGLVTSGGRVLGVTAVGSSLKESVERVYKNIDKVVFKGAYYRKDIAHRAFKHRAAKGLTYADSGVSVDNGNLLVEQIKALVKSTLRSGADSEIGGFGGLFDLAKAGYTDADKTLLVAATDGVGTKLRIAQEANIHDTVGIDLVAMNVNDLVVQGAEPLFFLDYFATGKLDISVARDFVKGVAEGCKQARCALVGGETLEMPGMYEGNHYDTNGTAVGAVLKEKMLPKIESMELGDVILGLKSDGLHSNGFSLVRKIIEVSGLKYSDAAPWVKEGNVTVAEACLVPTRIYVALILEVLKSTVGHHVVGLAHITGGGLVENVPRCLPKNLGCDIQEGSWPVPEVFTWFAKAGNVPEEDFYKTFNGGIGMVVIVKAEGAQDVKKAFEQAGEVVYDIGKLGGALGCRISK